MNFTTEMTNNLMAACSFKRDQDAHNKEAQRKVKGGCTAVVYGIIVILNMATIFGSSAPVSDRFSKTQVILIFIIDSNRIDLKTLLHVWVTLGNESWSEIWFISLLRQQTPIGNEILISL